MIFINWPHNSIFLSISPAWLFTVDLKKIYSVFEQKYKHISFEKHEKKEPHANTFLWWLWRQIKSILRDRAMKRSEGMTENNRSTTNSILVNYMYCPNISVCGTDLYNMMIPLLVNILFYRKPPKMCEVWCWECVFSFSFEKCFPKSHFYVVAHCTCGGCNSNTFIWILFITICSTCSSHWLPDEIVCIAVIASTSDSRSHSKNYIVLWRNRKNHKKKTKIGECVRK